MENEIVVFGRFENTIEANLVKTKLDAYGIPCFLTEENLSNLYPGQSFLFFNVRLHLFASDVEQANQIMAENNLSVHEEVVHRCPKCQSENIKTHHPKSNSRRLSAIVVTLLTMVFLPLTKIYRCENCLHEFKL